MGLVAKLRAFKVFFHIPVRDTILWDPYTYDSWVPEHPFCCKSCASLWCAWSICLNKAPKVCTNNLLCHFSGYLIPENDHYGLHAAWALSYKLHKIFVEACLCCLCQKQVLRPCIFVMGFGGVTRQFYPKVCFCLSVHVQSLMRCCICRPLVRVCYGGGWPTASSHSHNWIFSCEFDVR